MAGLGFQLERSELVQSWSSARDVFLALRFWKGEVWAQPAEVLSPQHPLRVHPGGGGWLRGFPGLGVGGIKSHPLGKKMAFCWL